MLIDLLYLLVWVIIAAIVFFAVCWILEQAGWPLPPRIKQLLGALLAVFVLIWFISALTGIGPPMPHF